MRVLITGSAGYVGAVLTRMMKASGHEVTGVDTHFFRDASVLDGNNGTNQRSSDIRQLQVADFHDVDGVVDLAALSNDPLGNLCAALTFEVNHLAAVRTARLAREAGVSRFVFSSSCSIYGLDSREPLTEADPVRPMTPYAVAKHLAECDIARLATDDFSPTFLRNATAFGPSPNLRLDLVVNFLTALACVRKEVRLRDDGLAWRPFVHVADLCQAVIATLEAPREVVHNEIFNVGRSDNCHRISEIAELVTTTVPDSTLGAAVESLHDKRSYRIDSTKIFRAIPGLRLDRTVRQGIEELAEFYRSIDLDEEDLVSGRFERLAGILRHQRTKRLDDRLYWTGAA
ncbi:NAD-dependent epimerase/dehydratase family protein [Nonomuraea jiangxiensis]|uniref:Nucleoside-diphosphate-sugar epimerase n=1 Tax=Nonomuraea jiangxiensis TaxID=633440 RepID=A0A1G8T1C7_9ACTN|nr:SDR family oxidoreductase [Nonomuraea jiangxiensis]SDJ35236.1 Nucleoside-diphosphate-sugar epimerase [Nonomuraea jiangxiensis]